MHRHGYVGRKFGRTKDQRRALMRGLATSLIMHESVETTLPKAKAIRPFVERLITKAKVGSLHTRRQVMSEITTREAGFKLVDELAPKLTARNSGYLRIVRTGLRTGDNAQMARISFVDDLAAAPAKPVKRAKPVAARKPAKRPAAKTAVKEEAS